MPKRVCVRSCSLNDDGTSTTYDVINVTPKEGAVNNKVGWEPKNVREARAHSTWAIWKTAMDKEVKGLLGRGTWVEIQRSQVPAHVKICLLYTSDAADE